TSVSIHYEKPILGIEKISNSSVEQSNLVSDTPLHDNDDKRTFLLQIASVPGSQAKKIDFEQSRPKHDELMNRLLSKSDPSQIDILVDLEIEHKVLLASGYSLTQEWGLEPNLYLQVRCTEDRARSVSALFGTAFSQDGVGIVTEEEVSLKNKSDRPDDVHRYIKVSRRDQEPIKDTEGHEIIKAVKEKINCSFSAQADKLRYSVVFHDYECKEVLCRCK
ncbi:unnamed protein product, partial [Didymodactylos carnosus]